jgi:hypothetical protein
MPLPPLRAMTEAQKFAVLQLELLLRLVQKAVLLQL